jgi:glucose dehydrogenase
LNLLFWGTSVPAPSPEVLRGTVGLDVLYSNSTLALNADTGEIVWYYQHLPRDNWDFDHPFERMIMDTEAAPNPDQVEWISPDIEAGRTYKTMTGIPGKTGIVYSLDRETGEFLWARTSVQQNVVTEIQGDGRVIVNEDVIPTSIDDPYGLVCPTPLGGKDWMPGAYNPDTNAIYVPLANMCFEPEITTDEWTGADGYAITISPFLTPGEEYVGTLQAFSVETGDLLWKVEQDAMFMPVLSTGGGLIFVGDVQRRFHAFDASTGDSLWTSLLSSTVSGHPVSYEVDGVQYVAVATGGGFIEGFYNSAAGLSAQTRNNALFVFRLP